MSLKIGDGLLVAEQIVIDDEDDAEPGLPERFELGQDLPAGLETRAPAKVAELAGERAAREICMLPNM